MSDTEVMDAVETETKERKFTPLTDAQKEAAGKRREASLLRKYGYNDKAAALEAEADAIAPVRATGSKRVDPLTALTTDETVKLLNYFATTKKGFAKIAEIVSYKRLAAIAAEL